MTSNLDLDIAEDQNRRGITEDRNHRRPMLAASIILVRDRAEGYEVFMIERPRRGTFPRLHVFPGGKVESYDRIPAEYCASLTDTSASEILNVQDNGLSFWVSAIRECFEECGVLFARQNSQLISTHTESGCNQLQTWARDLATAPEYFPEFLKEQRLTLAADELVYFSHWITPEFAPARFDTRFFLAKLPPNQHAHVLTDEVVSGCWVQPEEALRKFTTNAWKMILPTLTTLRMISHYLNVDDLITQSRAGYHKIPVRTRKQLQGMQPFLR